VRRSRRKVGRPVFSPPRGPCGHPAQPKTSAQAAKAFTHRSAEVSPQGHFARHGLGL